MADLDEEAATINLPNQEAEDNPTHININSADADAEAEDEPPDFLLLTHLSNPHPTNQPRTLPKRGEKDFEPHGLSTQENILSASRSAMHTALSYPRLHAPKALLVGVYDHLDGRVVVVGNPRGGFFRTMGGMGWGRGKGGGGGGEGKGRGGEKGGKGGGGDQGMWLLPEEALYLVERGGLDVRWGVENGDGEEEASGKEGEGKEKEKGEEEEDKEEEEEEERGVEEESESDKDTEQDEDKVASWTGLPFSLQTAYSHFIGRMGLSLEAYTVYASLRRSGYVVARLGDEVGWPRGWYNAARDEQEIGGDQIYQCLSIIPFHDPSSQHDRRIKHLQEEHGDDDDSDSDCDSNHLRLTFAVWKPRPDFRKSRPGPPDFRIAVINAREQGFPSLQELDVLLQSVPYDPPPQSMDKQLYQKLKHGYRNVILAVVDQGVVSYVRIADAAFGKEKIYNRPGRGRGGKRGGGRGRGRGRGRGSAG
ncbi:Histone transcription regulator 3 [Bachmanniomyces sp. S44760]|nr:Histone transcription regulator 3 [Bachmanniomyces sp. S44760]